jgi:hypothetical protein
MIPAIAFRSAVAAGKKMMSKGISKAKTGAKVKGYKAKEAFRVTKGKTKYAASKLPGKAASKFPKTAAKAGKYKKASEDAFKTFGKTKSGIKLKTAGKKANSYLDKNLGTILVSGSTGLLAGGYLTNNQKKKKKNA